MKKNFWCRVAFSFRWLGMVAILSFLFVGRSASAQLDFSWNGIEPDISTYQSVEQCLGVALKRIIPANEPPWYALTFRLDTFPRPVRDSIMRSRDNSAIVEAATKCGAKFTVDGVLAKRPLDINETMNAFKLFLLADRVPEAMDLADRWLASFPSRNDTVARYTMINLADALISESYPPRYREALSFVHLIDTVTHWRDAFYVYNKVYTSSKSGVFHDFNLADSTRDWIIETPNWLGEEVIQSREWQDAKHGMGQQVAFALEDKERHRLWALLRQSTERYHDEIDSIRKRAKLQGTITRTIAPPIVAHSWFPSKPAADRPTRGRVSVVRVISMGQNMLGRSQISTHLDLRRMMAKFPDVEVTYVMSTMGFNGPSALSMEDEARMIDSLYRGKHKLPVTLAIYHRTFWRLPEPDRRRINEPGPNDEVYETLPTALHYPTYIIDREGRIIRTSNIDRDGVWWQHPLEGFLEAVLAQPNP